MVENSASLTLRPAGYFLRSKRQVIDRPLAVVVWAIKRTMVS